MLKATTVEKEPLLPSTTISKPSDRKFRRPLLYTGLLLLLSSYYALLILPQFTDLGPWLGQKHHDYSTNYCPQADVLVPEVNGELWNSLTATIGTASFKSRAVEWLGGAVRVPTESFDDLGPVGKDRRWDVFAPFHEYLLGTYPLVHTTLNLTKVNTYGLLYVWQGSDASLKPVLLAGHQDVVPVDPTTVDKWTHPPFSGYFDGERVWGRGSSDDKSGLIGILSGVETLLEKNFQPTRSVVLAFGFDEEVSGRQGAQRLSEALLDLYGKDGFALIVDEGSGFSEQYGSVVALPGIAEKGYIDVRVEVTAAGGHSSIPPEHTSIGILSSLLVEYEANPYEVHLSRKDPLYSGLQCVSEHARDVPADLRRIIKRSASSDKALHALEKEVLKNPTYRSLVGTTQAIDLIQGGVKANALPERAWAVVNHRISVASSVEEVQAHDAKLLESLAAKFNLTYNAFGATLSEPGAPSSGTLTLSDAFGTALHVAPVTPTGKDAAPYQLLSGTIKAAYNSHRSLQGTDTIVVSPGMMSGNTDTRYYWDLSKHIFRYNHANAASKNGLGNIHTVNESMDIDSFLEMIRFFITLILNADEVDNL
ncbi:Carboxypeptidase S [Hypsizygus marmoreus]|uniref:Carboxypeptidase S n=1 Tax=Hypsizygus marmoreus TaxID=39966 RepID=A0A369JVD8_HYPMA|nr:Carboxypeptidase S [Hypsizygus marmoreus]